MITLCPLGSIRFLAATMRALAYRYHAPKLIVTSSYANSTNTDQLSPEFSRFPSIFVNIWWPLVQTLSGGLVVDAGKSLGVLLVLFDSPVEDVVVLEALSDKEVAEDLA